MPTEHPSPANPDPAEHATDGTVLDLLLDGNDQRPWATHELALEIGSPIVVTDAVANLRAAGLVHQTSDGFVFPTRAAVRANQLRDS